MLFGMSGSFLLGATCPEPFHRHPESIPRASPVT